MSCVPVRPLFLLPEEEEVLLLKWVSRTRVMGTWVFFSNVRVMHTQCITQIPIFIYLFAYLFIHVFYFYILQVVDRIRQVAHRTRLLVVDRETDAFLRSRGLPCTEDLAVEMGNLSPRPSPGPTPSNSPLPRGISPLLLKSFHMSSLATSSPTDPADLGGAEASSETSGTESDTEVCGLGETALHFR